MRSCRSSEGSFGGVLGESRVGEKGRSGLKCKRGLGAQGDLVLMPEAGAFGNFKTEEAVCGRLGPRWVRCRTFQHPNT